MSAPAPRVTRDVGVVIVARQIRSRIGGGELKQLRWVAGKPMLLHSLQTFQKRADVAMVSTVSCPSAMRDPPPSISQSDAERLFI